MINCGKFLNLFSGRLLHEFVITDYPICLPFFRIKEVTRMLHKSVILNRISCQVVTVGQIPRLK